MNGVPKPARDGLKLRAHDAEDLRIVSAVLQDALVPVRDMDQVPRERRFAMVVNRFRWEARAPLADLPDMPRESWEGGVAPTRTGDAAFEDAPLYERVQCGVTFDRVARVQTLGISRGEASRIVNLLAVMPEREGVRLSFSGGGEIFLQGRWVVCHLEDLGEPWPTRWRPSHDVSNMPEPGAEADPPAPDAAGRSEES